ncbi:MAG: hypothetical protein JKY48_09310 [Flavobacteriales bacterium]|nr:hypothetical protein [Flavobacteriales bacterium]
MGFGLKLLSAIALWIVYTYIYSDRSNTDIYKFFGDAAYIFEATKDKLILRYKLIFGLEDLSSITGFQQGVNFWHSETEVFFNDNRTMIRVHLLLYHFSQGFYLLHILFFAFLSFIGSMGLFKFFKSFSSLSSKLLFAISFLPPSLLFWSSAPLKESYLLFSLGLLLYGVSIWLKRISTKAFFFIGLGIFLLLTIKLYILFSLLPGLILILLLRNKTLKIKLLIAFSLILTSLFFIFQEELINALANKQLKFKELIIQTKPKSAIPLNSFSNLTEFILVQPQAFFNVFIKPAWPTHWNMFTIIAAIEHLVYIAILSLPFLFKRKTSPGDQLLVLYSISFLIIATSIIGSTTPILGAIVRYKSPLIPFYLITIFTLIDFSKLTKSHQ